MSQWKCTSLPIVTAAIGSNAIRSGVARQCTMQIVDSVIAIRSKYREIVVAGGFPVGG